MQYFQCSSVYGLECVQSARADWRAQLWKLTGTGGSWFLYDVAFYGTAVFTPPILASIFGAHTSVHELCAQTCIVLTMQLPGLLAAIAILKYTRMDLRTLQILGFALMAAAFADAWAAVASARSEAAPFMSDWASTKSSLRS